MSKLRNIKENPFSRFSAEEEEDIVSIYLKPRYYDALKSNAKQGNSRILVGQRGLGKSATIFVLFNELAQNKTLPLLISRYDGFPLTNNKNYFLHKILQSLSKEIVRVLQKNPDLTKKMNKTMQGQLSFFIELFYDLNFAEEFINQAKIIKSKKRINRFKTFFNRHLRLINSVVNGIVKVTSSIIRKSIGLPEMNLEETNITYFNELPIDKIRTMTVDEVVSMGSENLTVMLKSLISIALAIGFESIVVLFDKIDEYSEVNSDINKVADFVLAILTDTDLLYTDNLSIVFSLWSEVKHTLNNRGVRFDKFQDTDISWRDNELEALINKRLLYYSLAKEFPVTLEQLLPFDNDRKTVLELADGSPRSLISLLNRIYDEENATSDVTAFSSDAINRGLLEFCIRFDYLSLQPSRTSNKSEFFSWLNKVLIIKKPTFVSSDIQSVFSVKSPTASKYISEMLRMGIIKNLEYPDKDGKLLYEVIDPRIRYLMKRGVTKLS